MLKLNKTATVLIWLLVGYLFMVEMSGVMIASMELVFILVAILAYGWLSKVRKTSEQEERPQPSGSDAVDEMAQGCEESKGRQSRGTESEEATANCQG
jgi:Na+-transporting methylmalonyl-CoA/oxaloacetate decarboxylase gamma subunit